MIVKIFENSEVKKNHFYEVTNLKYTKASLTLETLPQGCVLIGSFCQCNKEEVIILNLVEAITRLPFIVVVAGKSNIYIMNNEAKTIEVIKLPCKSNESNEMSISGSQN